MVAVLPCSDHTVASVECDAQLLLVGVLPWQLITAASFFRVGVEVVSAAMLCSQAHSLTRCLRSYFVGRGADG